MRNILKPQSGTQSGTPFSFPKIINFLIVFDKVRKFLIFFVLEILIQNLKFLEKDQKANF